ncbi:MAG: PqqD family protein [Bacteroidetes bacterium]|nr:MAG: PqqD family protein [Bacteroidota bacterium]
MQINKNIAISDNGFLFNPSTGESYNLNTTGTELLKLIKEGKSLKEITTIFLEKYETSDIIIEKDYQDFVKILDQYNLTEEAES